MATPSTEQHPLTVETSMMSYETPSRRLQNGHCIIQEQNETSSASAAPTVLRDSADIETQLPPLRALGSPLQLSLKVSIGPPLYNSMICVQDRYISSMHVK